MPNPADYVPGTDPGEKCDDGECGMCDQCYREYVAAKMSGELDD